MSSRTANVTDFDHSGVTSAAFGEWLAAGPAATLSTLIDKMEGGRSDLHSHAGRFLASVIETAKSYQQTVWLQQNAQVIRGVQDIIDAARDKERGRSGFEEEIDTSGYKASGSHKGGATAKPKKAAKPQSTVATGGADAPDGFSSWTELVKASRGGRGPADVANHGGSFASMVKSQGFGPTKLAGSESPIRSGASHVNRVFEAAVTGRSGAGMVAGAA